jgi:hypothetical protein
MYFDMVPNPADLDLGSGSWTIDLATGLIAGRGGNLGSASATSFLATSPSGIPIRVFVVNKLVLGDVWMMSSTGNNAVAFLASSDISVTSLVTLFSSAGSTTDPSCLGGKGVLADDGACTSAGASGGGGVTSGGGGGFTTNYASSDGTTAAVPGGGQYGSDALEPLVGGCAGGGMVDPAQGAQYDYNTGGAGGGALQLSSRTSITIAGKIDADGSFGNSDGGGRGPDSCAAYLLGGGAGGGILVEAPSVSLLGNANLSALGGPGAQLCNTLPCADGTTIAGAAGVGGTPSTPPTNGGNVAFNSSLEDTGSFMAGGGGGSVGRIRINTPNGKYSGDPAAQLNAVVSTGILSTR